MINQATDLQDAQDLTLLIGLVVILSFLGPLPEASAHATLLFTTPAVDGAVPTSPQQIQLVFDEPVRPSGSTLQLIDDSRRPIPTGSPESGSNGQTLTAKVLATLPAGQYVVHWQVAAEDGDIMRGEYGFAVGSTAGLTLGGGQTPATEGLLGTTVLRWLLFLGLAFSLGGTVGSWLVRRGAPPPVRVTTPRAWGVPGALLGVAAGLGTAVLYIGDGSFIRGLAQWRLEGFLAGTPGRVAAAEVVAFALAAAALHFRHSRVGGLLLLVIPAAEGLRAHPQATVTGWGALLTGVHLAAAAIWVGALIHVLHVCHVWRRQQVSGTAAVRSYAWLAVWLFLTVVLTGSVAGLLLVPTDALLATLFKTAYGQWLVAKLAFVGLIAGLALTARRHLRRQPNRPQPSIAARFEAAALVLVLGLSALLTALAPPIRSDTALPFPPPPVGPVVAVGGRAGWVGIGVSASAGQVVVRLTTPQMASPPEPSPRYELAGNLTDPQQTVELRFRACGTGCFVAPVQWPTGVTTLTLNASAEGWPGGTSALNIAWPPKPAANQLRATVQAMRGVSAFTLYEQVTSDTSQGAGALSRLALAGPAFLDSEPYGSGVAPVATVIAEDGEETTLALAYPGEGVYALLTVDAAGRILRETLAAPNHLVSRTFVYPDTDDDHER